MVADKHRDRSAQIHHDMKQLTAAKKSAHRLGQSGMDSGSIFTDAAEPGRWEMILTGLIEGTVSGFGQTCKDGLTNTVHSVFRIGDNIALYDPTKLMKFGMSTNLLVESMNVSFAYCDFSHLYNEFERYLDYEQWENYVELGVRVGLYFIFDYGEQSQCIQEGKEADLGYDIGICTGLIMTNVLDTLL